jgi:hypothetical protein
MSLIVIGWIFTLVVLVHNAEEAFYLPALSLYAGRFHPPVSPPVFCCAVVLLSAIFIAITAVASFSPPTSLGAYLMAGYVLAMVLNVFIPHVAATIFMRRYMPGTATAVLLNLPLGLLYLYRAVAEQSIRFPVFYWAGPLVVVAIAALLPGLFALGRKLYPEPTT